MPDLNYPGSTGPFPARAAEPKAEPVTVIARDDATGWWDRMQADIARIGPDCAVTLQCRVIDGKLVHVGALIEPNSSGVWLTAPADARPDGPKSPQQLDQEDLEIQFDAALESVREGNLAVARAELNGALMLIDGIERRSGKPAEVPSEDAADRLVERIANRVVEMQAEQAKAAVRMVWPTLEGSSLAQIRSFAEDYPRGNLADETAAAIDKNVGDALRSYDDYLKKLNAPR